MAKMRAPDSMGGESTRLDNNEVNQGHYLMVVCAAYEGGHKVKDEIKMMDGFSFDCEVVGGPNAGKSYTMILWDGKDSSKDGGAMAFRKQFAALIATDVCKPDQLGKDIEFDPTEAEGALFIVELELGLARQDGKRYLEPKYSNIYHVDDPRVAHVRMDDDQKKRIEGIKATYRHPKEYFAPLTASKERGTSDAGKSESKKLDFDDL